MGHPSSSWRLKQFEAQKIVFHALPALFNDFLVSARLEFLGRVALFSGRCGERGVGGQGAETTARAVRQRFIHFLSHLEFKCAHAVIVGSKRVAVSIAAHDGTLQEYILLSGDHASLELLCAVRKQASHGNEGKEADGDAGNGNQANAN